jgi:beta-glucosidase
LFEVIRWLRELRKPILITECGTAETMDERRWQFIKEHLAQVQRALDGGSMVIGFLCWSLLDNFEWHHGFGPRFGLIDVDYTTFKRTIRPSARYFAEVIQKGRM